MAGMGITTNITVLIIANTKDITINTMRITSTDMAIAATMALIAMVDMRKSIERHILNQVRISSIQMMASCWFTSLIRREFAATDMGKRACVLLQC